jgi:flagellar biosynthesis protein FlhF
MTNAETSPRFFVKSFFANSMQDAMAQARLEMGPDALLLDTKPAPPEARHLGEYEVVFGEYADAAAAQETAQSEPPAQKTAQSVPPAPNTIAGVRSGVEDIRELLASGSGDSQTESGARRNLARVAGELVEAGVEPALARDIAESVMRRMHRRPVLDISRPRAAMERDDSSLSAELREELAARCPVQSELGPVTALVGPPGAGKTTTLVKLAVSRGLAAGKAVRLVTVDTLRIGAAAQLETFASILDVPFQAVETPAALAQVIDYAPANTLVLIDTPGYSASLFAELGGDLANLLARRQEIDTHLVLTASMRPEALRQAADLYGAFRPSKLLFTHLDEATSYAAMFCEAARRELPLSFFATGQSVPEDLEPADVRRISDALVWQLPKAMQAIA